MPRSDKSRAGRFGCLGREIQDTVAIYRFSWLGLRNGHI